MWINLLFVNDSLFSFRNRLQRYEKNPTFANIVGLFFKKNAFLHLKTLRGVVGLDGFTLYQHGCVAALDVLAGGCHGARDVAGTYQRTTGSNE